MKSVINVIKLIFVAPVTAAILWLINIGIFALLGWFITLSTFYKWLLGTLIYCIGVLICFGIIIGVSWLFKVKKISVYIISLLIIADGILWGIDACNSKHIWDSLECIGTIIFAVFTLCEGASKAVE